jgi:hypothetical protein
MPQKRQTKSQAVDLSGRNRPGVPMEVPTPEPLAGSRTPIEPQHSDVKVFKDPVLKQMPPVFGTAQPPAGLSGLLRKLAYRYPTNWARRWMVLMLADRVDAVEHGMRRSLRGSAALASVLLVGGLTLKFLRN